MADFVVKVGRDPGLEMSVRVRPIRLAGQLFGLLASRSAEVLEGLTAVAP
jgi:hypothetical protein